MGIEFWNDAFYLQNKKYTMVERAEKDPHKIFKKSQQETGLS
jgi:hypothetical protein